MTASPISWLRFNRWDSVNVIQSYFIPKLIKLSPVDDFIGWCFMVAQSEMNKSFFFVAPSWLCSRETRRLDGVRVNWMGRNKYLPNEIVEKIKQWSAVWIRSAANWNVIIPWKSIPDACTYPLHSFPYATHTHTRVRNRDETEWNGWKWNGMKWTQCLAAEVCCIRWMHVWKWWVNCFPSPRKRMDTGRTVGRIDG